MTDEMIRNSFDYAKNLSLNGSTVWIMANGRQLTVVTNWGGRQELIRQGYWVVAIYEHGHQVDL